jgi:CRP/FNR family transcriptional regulator, cyclic AMP receptor protein
MRTEPGSLPCRVERRTRSRNVSDALRIMASRRSGRLRSVVRMINPTATALASSAACIATTSSWWAVVRRGCVTADRERPNPKALQAKTVDAMSPVTQPTAALHRDLRQALIASGIFGKTDSGVVSALIEHLLPVRFPPGHVVFAQGDPGSCLYVITSGKVKVAYRHTDGREVVLNIVGASDVFGEVTPFDYGTREFTATAVIEVCAVAIERDQLLAWMAECPEIIHQIMRLLARRADVVTKCLVDFVFADPPYRVARRLLLLGRRFGRRESDVVRVTHDLTLEEISLFAGVAPETVDATLRDFRDRGWIRFEDSCLEIVDGRALAALPARQ